VNTRTFDRQVVQRWFYDWHALDRENTRIWDTSYRPRPLYADVATWEDWMPEYRQLVIEVQEMWEECRSSVVVTMR
jgi:hypothetical protein